MTKARIKTSFENCAKENRAALVTFITAGYPNMKTSQAIIDGLPKAGADLIELGMPFSDPMADGPTIEMAGHKALENGHNTIKTLEMVTNFRKKDQDTPIILMGYYNPIYIFGVDKFLDTAKEAGVDGLIIVDLPSEEDEELCIPALKKQIDFIRLTTPTTDDKRLKQVLKNSSGFVYYVSMTGITGTAISDFEKVSKAVKRIKSQTDLPVAVGFGIKTAKDVAQIAKYADGVVVGSAIIKTLENSLKDGQVSEQSIFAVHKLVGDLARGLSKK
jgi:tryptophan synthase alpha chain